MQKLTKTKLIVIKALAILLIFLLFGQMSFQVYAQTIPAVEVKTLVLFNNCWNENFKGRWLQIKTSYVMEKIDTTTLTGIPKLTQLKAYGWVEVNGERIQFIFNTTKYPTEEIYNIFKVSSTSFNRFSQPMSMNPVYEIWDGITFITTASSPLYVRYNHPDNGPYSPPTYEIYPNEVSSTILKGDSKYHCHIPVQVLDEAVNRGTLMALIGGIIDFILALLLLPEPIISKTLAVILAIIAGVLSICGLTVALFIGEVLRTEMNDGWTWLWGIGKWGPFHWWWQSFGKWRDWGWFFLVIDLFWGTTRKLRFTLGES